jgi:hypothetical protein
MENDIKKFRNIILEADTTNYNDSRKVPAQESNSRYIQNLGLALEDIKSQLLETMYEARDILHKIERTQECNIIAKRANAYWYAHIKTAIGDSEYSSGSATTLQNTIDELRNYNDSEEEDF